MLKGIRQEHPEAVILPKAARLDPSTVDEILSALNTTRVSKHDGSERDVMWAPSVQTDPDATLLEKSPGA